MAFQQCAITFVLSDMICSEKHYHTLYIDWASLCCVSTCELSRVILGVKDLKDFHIVCI